MSFVDLSQNEVQQNLGPLPAGVYHVRTTNVERKSTSSGTGEYLNVEFTVTGGDYEGRKIWRMFNLWNKSEKAQQIARDQFKTYLKYSTYRGDLDKPGSLQELMGTTIWVTTKVKKDETYGDKSEILYWHEENPTVKAGDVASEFASAPGDPF